MRKVNNIPEIKAELLLNYLYPEAGSQWSVQNEGIFYRNYNSDLLSINKEKMEAQTAKYVTYGMEFFHCGGSCGCH